MMGEADFVKEFGGLGVAILFMGVMLRWFMTRNEQLMNDIQTTIKAHSDVIHELQKTLAVFTYALRPEIREDIDKKEK